MKKIDECQIDEKLKVVTVEQEIAGKVTLLHVAMYKNFDGKYSVGLSVSDGEQDTEKAKPMAVNDRKSKKSD